MQRALVQNVKHDVDDEISFIEKMDRAGLKSHGSKDLKVRAFYHTLSHINIEPMIHDTT